MTNRIYRRKRVNFLKYYPLIREVVSIIRKIKKTDLDMLLFLDDVVHFHRGHFEEGMCWKSWDPRQWKRLEADGWIEKFYKGTGRGDHSKYKLSLDGRRMVTRFYKHCYLEEELPTSTLRNPIMKGKTYKDKQLIKAINSYNKDVKNERSKKYY